VNLDPFDVFESVFSPRAGLVGVVWATATPLEPSLQLPSAWIFLPFHRAGLLRFNLLFCFRSGVLLLFFDLNLTASIFRTFMATLKSKKCGVGDGRGMK
jgi:hypothetical protein